MKLFFREYGQGEPIIILHGLFGMSDNWVSVAKDLSENYRVIIPDSRNHGLSPHSSIMDYKVMSEDLKDLISNLEINDFILIGHSMGGKVAMKFALENPNIVKKLIVVDIAPKRYPVHYKNVIEAFNSVDFSLINTRMEIDQQLKIYIEDEQVRQLMMKNLFWKSKNCLNWKLNIDSINKNFENLLEEITSINIFENSTLFLKGEYSDYLLDEDRNEILAFFPRTEFIEIRNASHWVHSDSKSDFVKSVQAFLKH